MGERINQPVSGPSEPEIEYAIKGTTQELGRIKEALVREHPGGHIELGEFCPLCQSSRGWTRDDTKVVNDTIRASNTFLYEPKE